MVTKGGEYKMSFGDEMKKIGENVSASYDARIGTLEDIYKDTQSTLKNARGMVKDFHGERMHMSEELKADLEHYRKELSDMTRKMINEFAKQHREMATAQREDLDKFHHSMYKETHTMLNEFRNSFEKMAQELRKMLTGYYKGEIQKPVHDMLSTFHSQMNTLRGEFKKAHEAWISISRSMSAKRGMAQAPRKMMTKSERICNILQAAPKGMTPGQISKGMGCSSQSLRTTMSNLKKQGRITKRQNKYFFKG